MIQFNIPWEFEFSLKKNLLRKSWISPILNSTPPIFPPPLPPPPSYYLHPSFYEGQEGEGVPLCKPHQIYPRLYCQIKINNIGLWVFMSQMPNDLIPTNVQNQFICRLFSATLRTDILAKDSHLTTLNESETCWSFWNPCTRQSKLNGTANHQSQKYLTIVVNAKITWLIQYNHTQTGSNDKP